MSESPDFEELRKGTRWAFKTRGREPDIKRYSTAPYRGHLSSGEHSSNECSQNPSQNPALFIPGTWDMELCFNAPSWTERPSQLHHATHSLTFAHSHTHSCTRAARIGISTIHPPYHGFAHALSGWHLHSPSSASQIRKSSELTAPVDGTA